MENNEMLVKTEKELEIAIKDRKKQRNIFIAIIIIIILLLGLTISIYLVGSRITFFGQAKGPQSGNVELQNSYMFASPLKARADGNEKIRITVFVLDSNGRGVFGKTVNITNRDNLSLDVVQQTTDDLGRAIFDVSTLKKGLFVIEANVGGMMIPQKINISFE